VVVTGRTKARKLVVEGLCVQWGLLQVVWVGRKWGVQCVRRDDPSKYLEGRCIPSGMRT
jgi:hypothetical protein